MGNALPIDKRGETRIKGIGAKRKVLRLRFLFTSGKYFLCGEKSTLDQMIFMELFIQQRIY